MRNVKKATKYSSISFPDDFIDEIKKHIMKTGRYKSIADFARDAILYRIDMENNFQKENQLSVNQLNTEWAELKRLLLSTLQQQKQ